MGQLWQGSTTPYGVTRPQWVNGNYLTIFGTETWLLVSPMQSTMKSSFRPEHHVIFRWNESGGGGGGIGSLSYSQEPLFITRLNSLGQRWPTYVNVMTPAISWCHYYICNMPHQMWSRLCFALYCHCYINSILYINMIHLPIYVTITSLILGQSYDFPYISEITVKDTEKKPFAYSLKMD